MRRGLPGTIGIDNRKNDFCRTPSEESKRGSAPEMEYLVRKRERKKASRSKKKEGGHLLKIREIPGFKQGRGGRAIMRKTKAREKGEGNLCPKPL